MHLPAIGEPIFHFAAIGTKQTFSDDSQNDRFGVLSGRSADQCLLLGVKQPGISHRVFGCY
jgi:hypothetical protein